MGTGSALVLSTQRQAGLAIVRSLGKRGLSVVAGGAEAPTLGMLSRFSDGRYVHPPPAEDTEAFLEHLLAYLTDEDHDVVYGPTDQLTYLLARHADDVAATDTRPAVEDWTNFRDVFDKARLFERLADVAVPRPETHAPDSVEDVEALAPGLSYPAVLKPRSKTLWDEDGYSIHLVADRNYVHGPRELIDAFRRYLADAPAMRSWPPIVQQYVPGETTTTVVLAEDGDVRAHFQERRLRTVPPSGGSSALLSVVDDDRMRRYAERIVAALEWTGPAQIEFMQRPDDEFVLIEVNGRYWGSLPFAINCGVDFPWLHYQQLRGVSVSHDGSYRTDVIQRRTAEDLSWLAHKLADGDLAAIWPFLADFRRADHTFVSARDPLPTVWTLAQFGRNVLAEGVDVLPTPRPVATAEESG
jgi:predicted ATP-grasp superfamily ATP-dependent carboligase